MIKKVKNTNGFFMLEAIIALIVFAIGIIGVVQYQNNFLQSTADAYNRTIANYLAESIVGQITLDQPNLNKYVMGDTSYTAYNSWLHSVSSSLPKVAEHPPTISSATVNGATQLTIRIFWKSPYDSIVSSYQTKVVIF